MKLIHPYGVEILVMKIHLSFHKMEIKWPTKQEIDIEQHHKSFTMYALPYEAKHQIKSINLLEAKIHVTAMKFEGTDKFIPIYYPLIE